MQTILDVVKTIAAMGVICAIVEYLCPAGGIKNTLLVAIGVLYVLCLASPIIGLLSDNAQNFTLTEVYKSEYAGERESKTHMEWLEGLYRSGMGGESG